MPVQLDLPKGRYCVGGLVPPPVTNYVVFAVDMLSQIQSGFFNPNTNTVFVSGSFNGWPGTSVGALALTNRPPYNGGGNSNIYYATNMFVDLPGALFEYRFTDNNPNGGYEPLSTNRTLNLLSTHGVMLLPVVSFGGGISP